MAGCHCLHGWICEAHQDRPWPHDDCSGASAPCDNFDCPWWKGPSPAALSAEHWEQVTARNRRTYSERRDPQSARRHVSRGGRRATDRGGPYPLLLVADSDGEILVPYVRYLKRFGFAVQALVDGTEMLPAIQVTRPHAILMEPSLPSMPASRLAERLAEKVETQEIPIILMMGTAPVGSDSPPAARVAGVLLKPFPRASMLEEIRRVLRLHPPPPRASSISNDHF